MPETTRTEPDYQTRYESLPAIVNRICNLIEGDGPNPTRAALLRDLASQARTQLNTPTQKIAGGTNPVTTTPTDPTNTDLPNAPAVSGICRVPVRPTEDMYRAIRDRFRAPGGQPYPDSFYETIWSAMLSAGRFYD